MLSGAHETGKPQPPGAILILVLNIIMYHNLTKVCPWALRISLVPRPFLPQRVACSRMYEDFAKCAESNILRLQKKVTTHMHKVWIPG